MFRFLKKMSIQFKPFYLVKLLSSGLTQVSTLFLIYLLKPEDYGYLSLIISVAQLMFILTSGWTNGSAINLGSKYFVQTGSYINILFYRLIIIFISGLLVTISFIILKSPIEKYIILADNYRLIYLLFIGYILYDFSTQLLYPGNKDLLQSSLELLATLVFFILVVFFVVDVKGFVFYYTATYSTLTVLVLYAFFKYFGNKIVNLSIRDFKFVLNYSFWQILSIVSIYITNLGFNYVLVLANVNVKEIGLFNFAYKLFFGFAPIFALFGILIPKWVNNLTIDNLHNYLSKRLFSSVLLLSALYIIVAILLRPAIILIGKSDFLLSVGYFIYLFPAFVLMSYSNIMNTILMNTLHFKSAQLALVFQALSVLVLSLPLVKSFGIIGLVISISISYIVCSIYYFWLYRTKVKYTLNK